MIGETLQIVGSYMMAAGVLLMLISGIGIIIYGKRRKDLLDFDNTKEGSNKNG